MMRHVMFYDVEVFAGECFNVEVFAIECCDVEGFREKIQEEKKFKVPSVHPRFRQEPSSLRFRARTRVIFFFFFFLSYQWRLVEGSERIADWIGDLPFGHLHRRFAKPSTYSGSIALDDMALHRATVRRLADCSFISPTRFSLLGLGTLEH
uniref:Uncharacterized protein n=1 Tax=Solanum tuberosum TaxID=4113 RepID=M1DDL8_SOLTU